MPTPHEEMQAHIEAEIAAGHDPFGDDDPDTSSEEDVGAGSAGDPDSTNTEAPGAEASGQKREVTEGAEAPGGAPAAAATEQPVDADGTMSADEISAVLAAITPAQARDLKIQIPDISGVDAKLAEIESKTDDVEQRYMDGGITDAERMAELRKLNRERDGLNREKARAETVAYVIQQQAQNAQQAILDGLVQSAKADGINYDTDADAQVEFNAALKTAEAMPRMAGKPAAEIYATAHRMVLAARGILPAAPTATPPTPAAQQGTGRRSPPPMPPSIRGLPTAAAQTQGHGLDDVLRNSKGSDFDAKWARMTEDQRRAYLDD